jgi:polyisoprenoid-binding protein YceI
MRTVTRLAALALATLALPSVVAAAPKSYTVDNAHSVAGFRIRHLMTKVDGRFRDVAGTVVYDPQAPQASAVEVTIQAASIDTGTSRRDDHLRSPDFFEVEKYPTLTFKSVSVEPVSPTSLRVTGDLTIKGVTQRVTVPVEILGTMPFRGGEKAGFETTFTVDRKAYGVTWNRAVDQGGMLLGDDVEVNIRLQADWQPPAPPEAAAPGGR